MISEGHSLSWPFLLSSVSSCTPCILDADWAEIGAIGWTLSVLATVAVEIVTADLLRR